MLSERLRKFSSRDLTRSIEASNPTNCVIAALESAFHAHATTEEKKLRNNLIKNKKVTLLRFKHLVNTREGKTKLTKANLILETRSITSLFGQIMLHNTPLGKSMNMYSMQQRVIYGSQLDEVVQLGHITLVAQTLRDEEWHMIHAIRMTDGSITSGNDCGDKIVLKPDQPYLTYIFTKNNVQSRL